MIQGERIKKFYKIIIGIFFSTFVFFVMPQTTQSLGSPTLLNLKFTDGTYKKINSSGGVYNYDYIGKGDKYNFRTNSAEGPEQYVYYVEGTYFDDFNRDILKIEIDTFNQYAFKNESMRGTTHRITISGPWCSKEGPLLPGPCGEGQLGATVEIEPPENIHSETNCEWGSVVNIEEITIKCLFMDYRINTSVTPFGKQFDSTSSDHFIIIDNPPSDFIPGAMPTKGTLWVSILGGNTSLYQVNIKDRVVSDLITDVGGKVNVKFSDDPKLWPVTEIQGYGDPSWINDKIYVNLKNATDETLYNEDKLLGNDSIYLFKGVPNNNKYTVSIDHQLDDVFIDNALELNPAVKLTLARDFYLRCSNEIEISATGDITGEKDLTCVIEEVDDSLLGDLFGDALKNALSTMLGFVNATMIVANKWIDSVIDWGSNINDPALEAVWTNVRNVTLSLLTLAILIIAFANLLNIKPETFGATIIIPKLITTIVFVYFSYFFIQFILGMATALDKLLITAGESTASNSFPTDAFEKLFQPSSVDTLVSTGDAVVGYGYVIILFILGLAVVIAMVWICILLVIRIAMIFFLVALAPFAFMMDLFPFTSFLSKMWWAQFWKWAFMGPAVMFCLFIAGEFLNIGFVTSAQSSALSNVADNKAWLWLILYAVMLYAATMIPMQLGGKVMGAWSGLVKKTGKGAWNKTPAPDYLAARKSNVDRAKSKRARDRAAWVNKQGSKGGLRGVIAGSGWRKDAGLAQAIEDETLDNMGKDMASDKEGLKEVIKNSGRGSLEEKAAIRKAALTGKLDADDERTREAIKRYSDKNNKDYYIPEFEKTLAKENPDFFAEAALKEIDKGGADAPFFTDHAEAGMAKIQAQDYRANHWKLASKTGKISQTAQDRNGVKGILENAAEGNKKEFAIQMSAYLNSGAAHNLTKKQVASIHAIASAPTPGPGGPTPGPGAPTPGPGAPTTTP